MKVIEMVVNKISTKNIKSTCIHHCMISLSVFKDKKYATKKINANTTIILIRKSIFISDLIRIVSYIDIEWIKNESLTNKMYDI